MLPAWLPDTVTPDLDRALHYALLWGLEGLVLREVGRGSRVPNVNEARLRRRLEEAEMPVVAIDPGLFEGALTARAAWLDDLARLDDALAFCRRVGCPRIVVGALGADAGAWTPEDAGAVLREAGVAAARAGVRLAVRNRAGTACATGGDLAAVLRAADHPAVGAAWSPADALEAGEAGATGDAALLRDGVAVELVVVRDGREGDAGWAPAPLGEGAVGWPDRLRALHAAGFDGPLVLEVAPQPGTPVGAVGLREATALIRLARQARRG